MWRTDVAPFLREIQDQMGPDSGVERVVIVKPVQVGATEILLNVAGFYLSHAPSTVMIVEPNETVVKRLSRQRIEPMIELCPPLRERDREGSRKGGNDDESEDHAHGRRAGHRERRGAAAAFATRTRGALR